MDLTPTQAALTKRRSAKPLVIVAVILLILFAWTRGTFDNFLWKVGLNYNECATNGFGATFCGNDLKEYKARIAP
jgi:hypothetical protein